MYKRLTSNMRPGPDLLQKVPTLVLNVDFLMIMSVKGPVGSIYCKQSMFLSLLMIFCSYTPVKCDQVLIYCRQCLLLSWMLTFLWLCVSRDLWDPFIADSQCSCPCWWSSFIQTRDGYVQIITEIHSHSMCLCNLSCPDFHEGLFLWWCVCVCVCVENVRTTSVSCLCVCVCVCKCVCLCWGVSQNVRNWVCVCVGDVCGFVCVSRNLCDLVLNYYRQRLFLSCLMIFSCSIMTDYVQMIT